MSSIAFGSTYSFLTSATPSTGWVIGFDTDGILKQKDSLGNIVLIGGGPTAGNLGTYSLSQVLSVGNDTGIRTIIMGTATNIKSSNGGGKIELDRLGGTNSVLISTDNSSQNESYLLLRPDYTRLSTDSSKQMVELSQSDNQIRVYNNNSGSVTIGVHTGSLIYDNLDEIKISYNASATASTGNYDKNAVLIGTKNSKIGNGVVNTVVLGGSNFTASNSDSVYVPDVYLQNKKGIKSTDSNEVFYLDNGSGYTLLDRNSGNLDSSWLLMASDYQSTYQSYIQIGVNSDSGYGNDSMIIISNNKGPSYSYDEYSGIYVGKNILRLYSKDVDGTGDELRIDVSAVNNSIYAIGSTASFKGIEYNDDFSSNFVTHSLVDKQYVDSQFTGFTLDTVLAAGNNSESNDIVMGTATVIKSAQGGGQIDLDFTGNADEVIISTDNGSLGESYISLNTTDITVLSSGLITLDSNSLSINSNDLEGIKYGANYEATFVTQSLVNKGYVDSGTASLWIAIDSINTDYISEIITGTGLTGGGTYGVLNIDVNIGNGLEFVTNSIYLGGTLSQDTYIYSDSYNFELTNATNISLSASGVINNFATDLSGYYGQSYLDSNLVDFKVGFATDYGVDAMTYSKLGIQNHRITLETYNSAYPVMIALYSNAQTISDGSNDNRLIVEDSEFSKGLVYSDDYSANFTTYSLVSKGYVDLITQHVENGLTQSISGNIGLGGMLTQQTTIDGNSQDLTIENINVWGVTASSYINNMVTGNEYYTSQYLDISNGYIVSSDYLANTFSQINVSVNSAILESYNVDGAVSIGFYNEDQPVDDGSTDNRLIVSDKVNYKGLVYYEDYTANFTTYSLVSKGYVDSVVSSVGATNGLVELSNGVIGLGGTLSQDTIIYGDNRSLRFGSVGRITMTTSTYMNFRNESNKLSQHYITDNLIYSKVSTLDSATYSSVDLTFSDITIKLEESSGETSILITEGTSINDGTVGNKMVITDSSLKGFVYYDDYSANFSTFSLVTKGYVDSMNSASPGNGLDYISPGVIGLGGTLSTATNINGLDLYELNFKSMNRILMTASVYVDSAIYSNDFIFRNYLGSSDAYMIATDAITSTYSRVYLDYNSVNIESNDSIASVIISAYNKDTLIGDGSSNNRLVVDDSANNKGLVYNSDYSANFTTYSLVTKGYVDSKKPYLSYVALLTQTSTNPPTAVVLENDFGVTATFSYGSLGNYELHMNGQLTSSKTVIFVGSADQGVVGGDFGHFIATRIDNDRINLMTLDVNGAGIQDGLLNETSIEIRVYP